MNKVELIGRLTKDPEVRYTNSQTATAVARLTLAVDRRVKKDNSQNADFIKCVAFGKTAEFIEKHFRKGNRMGACGRIQTGNYADRDGKKVYTTDVVIEEVYFVESRNNNPEVKQTEENMQNAGTDNFMEMPEGIDAEGLPFN